jgi:hypothetical protein
VQFITHDVLAVGLAPGLWAWAIADVGEPSAGAGGTKQPAWHVAACALQVIMQFVVLEDCAKRIFPPADAALAKPATAATANTTAKHRIAASTGFSRPRHYSPVAADAECRFLVYAVKM